MIFNDLIRCNLSQGKRIKFSTSQAKNKLFIGNVPRSWAEDDLKNVVSKIGPGVIGVQLIKVVFFYLVQLPPMHYLVVPESAFCLALTFPESTSSCCMAAHNISSKHQN